MNEAIQQAASNFLVARGGVKNAKAHADVAQRALVEAVTKAGERFPVALPTGEGHVLIIDRSEEGNVGTRLVRML